MTYRALIGTIRDMGNCPCPACTVTKDDIRLLGTKKDEKARESGAREKTEKQRQDTVNEARKFINEMGFSVGAECVERLLSDNSWVPTEVCVVPAQNRDRMLSSQRMHSQPSLGTFHCSPYSAFLSSTSCMKLSLGSGRTSSLTSFASWIPSRMVKFKNSTLGSYNFEVLCPQLNRVLLGSSA